MDETDVRHDAGPFHQIDQILNGEITDADGPADSLIQQLFHASPSIIQCGTDIMDPTGTQRPVHHVEILQQYRQPD